MNEQEISKLYSNLTKKVAGFTMSEEDFKSTIQNEENRKKLHGNLTKKVDGFTMSYDDFNAKLGFGSDSQVSSAAPPVQQQEEATTTESSSMSNSNFLSALGGAAMMPQEHQIAVREKEIQRKKEKEEERKRVDNATLPSSEEDKENYREYKQAKQARDFESKFGKFSAVQKQHPIYEDAEKETAELENKLPKHMTRKAKNLNEVQEDIVDAHFRTDEGKQELAQIQTLGDEELSFYEKRINEYSAELQKQVDNGTMTAEDANAKLQKRWEGYIKKVEDAQYEAYQDYANKALSTHSDYFEKEYRRIGNEVVDEQYNKLFPKVDEKYDRWRQASFGAVSFDGSLPSSTKTEAERAEDAYEGELYSAAREYLVDAKKLRDAVKENKGFFSSFGENISDADTWDLGIGAILQNKNLKKLTDKLNANGGDESVLTEAERDFMQAAYTYLESAALNSDRLSRTYKMGQTTAESIPFMIEFAIMPLSNIEQGIVKGIMKVGSKQLEKGTLRYASRKTFGTLLGTATAAAVQTAAFSVPKIVAGSYERQTGQVNVGIGADGRELHYQGIEEGTQQGAVEATLNSIADNYIENLSEMMLTSFNPIGEFAGKWLGATDIFKKIGSQGWVQTILNGYNNHILRDIRKRVQFGGYFNEVLEEEAGGLLRLLCSDVNSMKEAGLDTDAQVDILLGLLPTSLFFGGMGTVSAGSYFTRTTVNTNKLLESMPTETERTFFESMIKSPTTGELGEKARTYITAVVNNPNFTPDEKRARLEATLSIYYDALSDEVKKAAKDVSKERYGDFIEEQYNERAHESGNVYLTLDNKSRVVLIKKGELHTEEKDGNTFIKSDKQKYTIQFVKEDGTLSKEFEVTADKLNMPIKEYSAEGWKSFEEDYAYAMMRGETETFEHDGKFYDINTLEEVSKPKEEPAAEEQLEDGAKRTDRPIPVVITIKDPKNGTAKRKTVFFSSDKYFVNEDGSVDMLRTENFNLQDSEGKEIKGKERDEYMGLMNEVLVEERSKARARADEAIAEKVAAQKKEDEQKAHLQQQQKERAERLKKVVTSTPMKHGAIDWREATPEQIFVYNINRYGEERALEEAKEQMAADYMEIESLKADKKMMPIERNAKIHTCEDRISSFESAVSYWAKDGGKALATLRNDVAAILKQNIRTEEAPAAAPTIAPTPKQEAPKKPKAEKKEAPTPTPAAKPEPTEPEEPEGYIPTQAPSVPIQAEPEPAPQSKTVDGWRDGMDVWADNVYLTKDNHGHLKLVEEDSAPKRAKIKHKIYLKNADGSFSGPYLLWSSMSPSKAQTNVDYIDENGVKHTIDRSNVYVQNENGEYKQLEATSRTHVTSFKTILDANVRIAGEEVSIADFLKPVKITVNVTKKVKGYLSGYEAFLQRLEKKGLTDEQLEEAKEQAIVAIRGWIDQWNEYAKHIMQTHSMDDKDIQRVRAKNLWIWRDVRDRYAKQGNLEEVDRLQKQIAEQIEPKVSSVNKVQDRAEASLRSSSFNNPLYQLALMIDVAKSMGAIQEEIETELPRHIEIVSNSKVITPKDIEAAREEYAKLKDPIKKEKLEKKFPEVKNDLPALTRFDITLEGEGARTPEVTNKAYDSSLQETYREMAKALKKQEEEKAGGEALTQLKDTLNKVVEAMAANDTKAIEELNKEVEGIMSAHRNERAFINAYNEVQRRVNQILREANPEEARKVDAIATVRRLLEQLEAAENEREELRNTENARSSLTDRIERMSNKIATIKEQIAREKAAHPELAEQFGLEEDRAEALRIYHAREKEVKRLDAEVKRLNTILTTVPKTREDQEALNEATEKIDDATEALKNAQEQLKDIKKRIPPRFTESYVGLNMTVQPEMSIVEENTMSRESKEARLAFGALRQVMAKNRNIHLHLAGDQENARRILANLLGVPELMSVFHGTPYHFDEFDSKYNRTGEGSNVYGWGHYVSENYETAAQYASKYTKSVTYFAVDGEKMSLEDIMRKFNLFDSARVIRMIGNARGYGLSIPKYLAQREDTFRRWIKETESQTNEEIEKQTNGEWSKEGLLSYYAKEFNIVHHFKKNIGEHDITQEAQPKEILSVEIPDDNGSNYLYWDGIVSPEVLTKLFKHIPEFKADLDKMDIEYNADGIPTNLTGAYVYEKLQNFFGDKISTGEIGFSFPDKEASKALRSIGIVGNRVPVAQRQGYSGELGYNYVIFNDNDLKITSRESVEFFKAPNGTILGWAIGNEIYLTDEGLNSETPIHEYTHLWVKSLRTENPKAWKKIVNLCKKNTSLWNKVKNDPNYANLTSDDEIASEVLSRYSGKRGSARLLEEAKAIVEEKGLSNEKMVNSLVNRMKSVLKEFWDTIKGLFNIRTMDDVSDWVLKDLFDGKRLNLSEEEMQLIKQRAIADGTFMKAPNGQPTQLTERQWLQVRTEAFKKWFGDWTKITFDAEGRIHIPDDVSKVVDKNGEPRVVYHGSERAGFYIFDPKDEQEEYYIDGSVDISLVSNGRGTFTTPQKPVAGVYARVFEDELENSEAKIGEAPHRGIYSLFANIKNPLIVDCTDDNGMPSRWFEIPSGKYRVVGEEMAPQYFETYEEAAEWMYEHGFGVESENEGWETEPELLPVYYTTDECVEMARREGYDGVVFLNIIDGTDSAIMKAQGEGELYNKAHQVITTLVPNQLKSATQNKGTFEMENDRIQFSYAESDLSAYPSTAVDRLHKQEEEFDEKGADLSIPIEKRVSAMHAVVMRTLDRMEGMRVIQNSIAAWREMMGLESQEDKYDVRNLFESRDSATRNKILKLHAGIKKELDEAVVELRDAVKESSIYKEYGMEKGGNNPAQLSPLQFVDRYLIARDNLRRAEKGDEDGLARGAGAFKQRMGIGMAEFVELFQENIDKALILNLWDKIKQMTDFNLDTALEGQLITQEEHDRLKAEDFYVPQRGFWDLVNQENPEANSEDTYHIKSRDGKRKNVLDSMHKAVGGESLAEGPLVYIYRDAEEVIKKVEDNKVRLALFHLLRDNAEWCAMPEHNFPVPTEVAYRVNEEGDIVRVENGLTAEDKAIIREAKKKLKDLNERLPKATGVESELILAEIAELEDSMPAFDVLDTRKIYQAQIKNKSRNAISVLVNGVQCEITLPDRFALTADALNGVQDDAGRAGWIQRGSSFIAATCTVNNPTFFAVNLTRDVGYVTLKGTAEYGPLFTAYFYKNLAAGQVAVNKWLTKHEYMDGKMGGYMQEFLELGANTGLTNNLNLERFRAEMKLMDVGTLSAGKRAAKTTGKVLQWAMLQPVASYLNEWSEITTRFAVYAAAREAGLSANEAVKAAHNLSVNFNRRGLGNQFLNLFSSLTVFVNATIQGVSGFWRTFGGDRHHPIQKALKAGSVMALAPAFLGFLNTILLPDDDGEEKWVSDWDRDNYMILPKNLNPFQREFGSGRIPLAQEIRPFWCIGVNIALMIKKRRTPEEVLNSIFTSLLTNGTPLPQNITTAASLAVKNFTSDEYHNIGEIMHAAIEPSFLESLEQLADNKNFMGGKTRYDIKDIPEYEMAPNASELARDISYGAYLMAGGDEKVPSKTVFKDGEFKRISRAGDINPKELRNYFFIIPSGYLDMLCDTYGLIKHGAHDVGLDWGQPLKEEDFDWSKTALVKKFVHENNPDVKHYMVKKAAKDMVKDFNNAYSNASDQAKRFKALAAKEKDEEKRAEYLDRADAAKERKRLMSKQKKTIEILNKLVGKSDEAAQRALRNKLHLGNDVELGTVIDDKTLNITNSKDKELTAAMAMILYDLKGLQYTSKDQQFIDVVSSKYLKSYEKK